MRDQARRPIKWRERQADQRWRAAIIRTNEDSEPAPDPMRDVLPVVAAAIPDMLAKQAARDALQVRQTLALEAIAESLSDINGRDFARGL